MPTCVAQPCPSLSCPTSGSRMPAPLDLRGDWRPRQEDCRKPGCLWTLEGVTGVPVGHYPHAFTLSCA